ncbi:MAG TPA: metallophosphoesterase family protein [Acetobacteraceae bacterium]|jgi:serine/threonine protein phosphatase 1|nr:metallophosphoesterase family protein [Acetobacteraceae bacterium]
MIDFIPAPASLPPGQRVYAVGDVHGCLDRLESVHELIAADLAERPTEQAVLVHLGDYVDRGPESAGVVARLAEGAVLRDVSTVNLMGNHEHMMLAALATGDAEAAELWLANGGADSLVSWGVPRSAQPREWPTYLPVPHLLFLRDLAVSHQAGGYLFVHAGIRPGIPLERQSRHDLMWIREPFLSSKQAFGPVVVHGHTPRQEPVVRPNRIGIDTGAVMGGVLTCAVLEENRLGFITV